MGRDCSECFGVEVLEGAVCLAPAGRSTPSASLASPASTQVGPAATEEPPAVSSGDGYTPGGVDATPPAPTPADDGEITGGRQEKAPLQTIVIIAAPVGLGVAISLGLAIIVLYRRVAHNRNRVYPLSTKDLGWKYFGPGEEQAGGSPAGSSAPPASATSSEDSPRAREELSSLVKTAHWR